MQFYPMPLEIHSWIFLGIKIMHITKKFLLRNSKGQKVDFWKNIELAYSRLNRDHECDHKIATYSKHVNSYKLNKSLSFKISVARWTTLSIVRMHFETVLVFEIGS